MITSNLKDKTTRVAAWTAIIIALLTALFVLTRVGGRFTDDMSSAVPNPTMSRVNKDGRIRVAVVPAPPITEIDPATKTPRGHAIDIIEAVAKNAQLQIEYVPSDWATVAATLSSGKADIAVGPIFTTEGRARDFAFSHSIYAYAIVAVGPRANSRVQNINDLKMPSLRIAVGKGGFDSEFVRKNMPDAQVAAFPPDDPNLPMLEILSGRADIALADFATAQKFVKEQQELEIKFAGEPVSLQYASFMLRNDDRAWKDFLDVSLRNLDLSGEMTTIDAKYTEKKTWYGRVNDRSSIIK